MSLIWVSDIHLNFLHKMPEAREEFYIKLKESEGTSILITGDIAESQSVVMYVEEMQKSTGKPAYFVLGNHDFYGSTIKAVKASVKHLDYLPKAPIELSKSTVLLGVDGWGDCRNGDYEHSTMTMSDWLYIKDLLFKYGLGRQELKQALQKLADADARALKCKTLKAIEQGYTHIIIATHVPPFEQASLYAGRKSTPSGLPFFSSKCLGDAILPIAKKNSALDFLWLSGHTHSRAAFRPNINMTVKVAKAEYYRPQIEEIFEYD